MLTIFQYVLLSKDAIIDYIPMKMKILKCYRISLDTFSLMKQ